MYTLSHAELQGICKALRAIAHDVAADWQLRNLPLFHTQHKALVLNTTHVHLQSTLLNECLHALVAHQLQTNLVKVVRVSVCSADLHKLLHKIVFTALLWWRVG